MPDTTALLASLLGAAGLVAACSWGLLKSRRAILAGQAAQCVFFSGHFAVIGAYTGAALCVLSLVQLSAAASLNSRVARLAFWATAPAIAAFAALTWHGPASAAAVIGLALGTLGRWQRDAVRLRWYFLGSSSGWAVHSVLVLSPFGMATDALTLTTNAWRLWRNYRGANRCADGCGGVRNGAPG